MADCPFCERIAAGEYVFSDEHAVLIAPLNPVTSGHLLAVPRQHVPDAGSHPIAASRTMLFAAQLVGPLGWAQPSYNLITSAGAAATQTVRHLHIHIVPREEGDGLHLPWAAGEAPVAEQFLLHTVGGPHPGTRVCEPGQMTWPLPACLADDGGRYVKVSETPPMTGRNSGLPRGAVLRGAEYEWRPAGDSPAFVAWSKMPAEPIGRTP